MLIFALKDRLECKLGSQEIEDAAEHLLELKGLIQEANEKGTNPNSGCQTC